MNDMRTSGNLSLNADPINVCTDKDNKSSSSSSSSNSSNSYNDTKGRSDADTSREDSFDINGGFTEKEKNVLSSGVLRNREYLIERHSPDEEAVFLGLADLLFSFCFDYRYLHISQLLNRLSFGFLHDLSTRYHCNKKIINTSEKAKKCAFTSTHLTIHSFFFISHHFIRF